MIQEQASYYSAHELYTSFLRASVAFPANAVLQAIFLLSDATKYGDVSKIHFRKAGEDLMSNHQLVDSIISAAQRNHDHKGIRMHIDHERVEDIVMSEVKSADMISFLPPHFFSQMLQLDSWNTIPELAQFSDIAEWYPLFIWEVIQNYAISERLKQMPQWQQLLVRVRLHFRGDKGKFLLGFKDKGL